MYALLCDYAADKDHCWPSQSTLAKRLSCSISSVKNYLGELVREKLISVKREQYRSSVYYLLRPAELVEKQKTEFTNKQSEADCYEAKSGYLTNLSKQSKEKDSPLSPHALGETTVNPVRRAFRAPAGGGCLPLSKILNPPGPCTPRKTPRDSPVWPGSSSYGADNSRRSRNFTPPSGALRPRKAGNANRAALCRKWATGCAGNAGSIRCRPPNRRNSGTIWNFAKRCGRGKSRSVFSSNDKKWRKRVCGLCLRLSRQNLRPLPTMQWPLASGCICTR